MYSAHNMSICVARYINTYGNYIECVKVYDWLDVYKFMHMYIEIYAHISIYIYIHIHVYVWADLCKRTVFIYIYKHVGI